MSDLPEIKTMTLQEVATLARCHVATVRRAIKNGELTGFRRQGRGTNGKILILADDALQWALGGADPLHKQKKDKENEEKN